MSKKYEYATELGALKARLEWAVSVRGRSWIVEGYNITRRSDKGVFRYWIDRRGTGGTTLAVKDSLTEAFGWVAERREEVSPMGHDGAAEEIAEFNRAAVFHPEIGEGTRPCLEVAGVLVFAYVDPEGTVRVSVHLDSAAPAVIDGDGLVPVRITLEATTVYD
ncbi:hypothetical protein ACWIG5_40550, partial [Streptomyces lydicus]